MVDFSVPHVQDAKVEQSQDEKFEKYQDLAKEIRRLWQVKVKVISLVVGALATIARALHPEVTSYDFA